MTAHDPKVLAAFQSGEERFVYARYRDDPEGELFFLPDGEARQHRELAKTRLECFIADCPDRRLTTVSRAYKRDGFRHPVGAGRHSRESLFHEQGKALIARWVSERFPDLTVIVEQATQDKARRADVMLTWPDGRQVAVEIQYAALTISDWQARHDSYRAQGITDVWLFGHHGVGRERHLRPTRARSWQTEQEVQGLFDLSPLHRAMAAAGVPILWISPIEEQVGTAVIDGERLGQRLKLQGWHRQPHLVGPRLPTEPDERAELRIDAIWDCHLHPDTGLVTPTARLVAETRQRLTAEAAHLVAEEQAAREREEQRRRERAERDAAERAEREARDANQREAAAARAAKAREKAARRRAEWRASPDYLAFEAAVPTNARRIVLDGGPDWYRGVYFDAERLRTTVYMRLIHGRAGQTFRYFDAINAVAATPGLYAESDRALYNPVRDYLWHLYRNGLLDWPNPSHKFIPADANLTVVADLTTPVAARCQWCQYPVDSASHQTACGPRTEPRWPSSWSRQINDRVTAPPPPVCEPPAPQPPAAPEPPKPADNPFRYQQLADWHADIGFLDHYAPGLRPIYGWHVEVFRKHVRSPWPDGLVPHRIAEAYDPLWVTEKAVTALLDHFAASGWLRRIPTPHGPVWTPDPDRGKATV